MGRSCHHGLSMEYEFQRFSLPRTLSRSAVRRMLTDHAEYGGWELARLRLFPDGTPQGRTAPQDHPGALDPVARPAFLHLILAG